MHSPTIGQRWFRALVNDPEMRGVVEGVDLRLLRQHTERVAAAWPAAYAAADYATGVDLTSARSTKHLVDAVEAAIDDSEHRSIDARKETT
ncbi:MAG: hypothetical protein H7Y15_08775 [Pseudonocardia sp.]|nr:hypothetical protein [Pseudonocardia sp.]